MALPTRVSGGLRPALEIVWGHDDGTVEDLSGATLTGTITDRAGNVRAIVGALTVTDGPAGKFEWDFVAADLATPGTYKVQFVATFPSAPSPAKSFATDWTVM